MGRFLKTGMFGFGRTAVREVTDIIKAGGVVIIPTDTVYGMAAIPGSSGIERIYRIKARAADKPLAVLISGPRDIEKRFRVSRYANRLMRQFWPGPLTIILGAADGKTMGYRVPAHPVALAILRKTGPLAVTSVNVSGQRSAVSVGDIGKDLLDQADLVVDAGPCPLGAESTVLDATAEPARIARSGIIRNLPLEG